MQKIIMQKKRILALVITGILATASPALAEKPSWAGNDGKGGKHQQQEKNDRNDRGHNDGYSRDRHGDDRGRNDGYSRDRHGDKGGRHDGYSRDRHDDGRSAHHRFNDHHRNVIHNYYTKRRHSGHCPPGLIKKHNGCVPPGHARRWKVGRPLPRDVIFYNLPHEIEVELGPPPPRHRFVRVASDILLIAVGTGMVVDAIDDLSGN